MEDFTKNRIEVTVGEELAVQVVQYDINQSLFTGNENDVSEAVGNFIFDNRNTRGIENIL